MSTPRRPQPQGGQAAREPQQSGPRPRILRIGVLLAGKLVEERLIRERVAVTIGQSMNNTFSIPIEGLPLQLPLFALDQGRYYLRFIPKMDGRLSDGGQVNTLEQLKARGAVQTAEYWQVQLSETSRGKLTLGDLTILFQFVTEPPRQPKPMLPASVRGTFADRFDPRLLVIIAISLLCHFTLMFWALFSDRELDDSQAERAYNVIFKQDTYDVNLEQPKPIPEAVGSAAGSAAAPTPKPDTKPSTGKPSPHPDSGGRNTHDNVSVSDEQEQAFLNALTGDKDPNGTSAADMQNRRPASTLGQQVADANESGRQVGIGNSSGRGSRGNGDPRVGTGTGPALNGPGGTEAAGGGKRPESGPSGRIAITDKQSFDDSTLTPDVVLSKILAAYMAGLKRCYKNYLLVDPQARGKVALEFKVNATGRTVDGHATGVADQLSTCIQGQMSLWRFPVPKDKDGEATEAGFKITLQLVPD